MEAGIGIMAGSLPALLPLLDLPFVNGDRQPAVELENGNGMRLGSANQLRPEGQDGDVDSLKRILKQTIVVMTDEPRDASMEEWERKRVLGWEVMSC